MLQIKATLMSICCAKIHNRSYHSFWAAYDFVKCIISKCYTHDLFLCAFFSDDLWENCNNARIFVDRRFRFFATSSVMFLICSPLFIKHLSDCVSVCTSVTRHLTLKFKRKIKMWRTHRHTQSCPTEKKLVDYIVQPFLQMLQKTGPFYLNKCEHYCNSPIDHPRKKHIKTNHVCNIWKWCILQNLMLLKNYNSCDYEFLHRKLTLM